MCEKHSTLVWYILIGFIKGPPAPKRIPYLFQNLSSLDVTIPQVKYERKSIVSSIFDGTVIIKMLLTKTFGY